MINDFWLSRLIFRFFFILGGFLLRLLILWLINLRIWAFRRDKVVIFFLNDAFFKTFLIYFQIIKLAFLDNSWQFCALR